MFRDCQSGLGHTWSLCHLVKVRECFEIVKSVLKLWKSILKLWKSVLKLSLWSWSLWWMWKSTNQLRQVRCRDTIATLFDKHCSLFPTFLKKKQRAFLPNLYEEVDKLCVIVQSSEIILSTMIWDRNLTFALWNYQLTICLSRKLTLCFIINLALLV